MDLSRNVLLVPMQPTPNGRLHVGHGAGTYLRADVLGRALRVAGHRVTTITGSDCFENWVLADALRSGRSPQETCDHHHAGIRRDLENLGVLLDDWIDPRSEAHYSGYRSVHEQALALLQSSGAAQLETERVPYSAQTGREVVGTWIAGECPNCGQPCGGSSCVYCGEHFQPDELRSPRSRLDDSALEWRDMKNWFARPRDPGHLLAHLEESGVRPVFLEVVRRYIDTRGGRIRLTGPGSWGIRSDVVDTGCVLANGYYLYSVYCGTVYQRLSGDQRPAFDPASSVTTIGIFGSDNSTPGLVAPHAIAQGSNGTLKPFDFTIVNGMLYFEGQKCSTSKRHGIWLSALLESRLVTTDELRFFLSNAPLDEGPADITLRALVDSVNEYRDWIRSALLPAAHDVLRNPGAEISVAEGLSALDHQHAYTQPQSLDLPAARRVLREWMQCRGGLSPSSWLLGVALLGEPFVPNVARQVWSQLGFQGAPTAAVRGASSTACNEITVQQPLPGELSVAALGQFVHISQS